MTKDDITKLSDGLKNASSVDLVWKVIQSVSNSFREGVISDLAEASLVAQITAHVSRIGEKEGSHLADFLKWNAEASMSASASEEPHLRIQVQIARENIGKIIQSLRWPLRLASTYKVLEIAEKRLGTEKHTPACWLINSLGWRSPEISKKLWDFAKRTDDRTGDLALSVLVELGVPRNKRSLYLKEVHRRYALRKTRSNIFAIGHLASPTSLGHLSLEGPWSDKEEELENFHFTAPTIAMISDRNDSKRVSDAAVHLLEELAKKKRKEFMQSLFLAGNVLPNIDSADATGFLLDLLADDSPDTRPTQHGIYLLLHRLEDCVRANQVQGLGRKRHDDKLEALIADAVGQTNDYTGRSVIYEGDIRERLWKLGLKIGNPETLSLAEKVLKADKNPYAQHHVLEDLSCFHLRSLPPRVVELITNPESTDKDQVNENIILRSAALRIAWSSETREGFETLLHSQYTHLGMTLSDAGDGLAHLSVVLARDSAKRREIVGRLMEKFSSAPAPPISSMVCRAIYSLAHSRFLSKGDYRKLSEAVLSESAWMEDFDRSVIISAIGTAPPGFIQGDLKKKLVELAVKGNDRVATSCFEALIGAGLFAELPPKALSWLGLARDSKGRYSFGRSGERSPNGGLIVLLLRWDYDRFSQAFASFLQEAPFRSFVEAIETFNRSNRVRKIPFSPLFSEALLNRAKLENSPFKAEPYIFQSLAVNDYASFAAHNWSVRLASWTPESKEALGNAFLLGSKAPRKIPPETITTLVTLQGDSNFAVRRSAFRSLGMLFPALLTRMAKSMALAEDPTQRLVGAEALYWIPITHRDAEWWTLQRSLASDAAEDVRDAVRDARARARKLVWAERHLSRLLAPLNKKESNRNVFDRWKYSAAIVHVGDDQTALHIRKHLRNSALPGHYQRFLIRTTETLEKNWENCRRKWPEPIFTGQGSIFSGEGKLTVGGEDLPIRYVTWRNLEVADPKNLTWGGTVILPEPLKDPNVLGQTFSITFSNNRSAQIFISRIEFPRRLSFVGNDETGFAD